MNPGVRCFSPFGVNRPVATAQSYTACPTGYRVNVPVRALDRIQFSADSRDAKTALGKWLVAPLKTQTSSTFSPLTAELYFDSGQTSHHRLSNTTISTRRFNCRPVLVSFGATGRFSPYDTVDIVSRGMPASESFSATI